MANRTTDLSVMEYFPSGIDISRYNRSEYLTRELSHYYSLWVSDQDSGCLVDR